MNMYEKSYENVMRTASELHVFSGNTCYEFDQICYLTCYVK